MYKFKISNIAKLSKANIVVLEGQILEGYITTTSTFKKESDETAPLINVKGVVMGFPQNKQHDMLTTTITLPLNQKGVSTLKIGDILIGNNK